MMISENFAQIKEIIDFFLLVRINSNVILSAYSQNVLTFVCFKIPGHHAMRMMTFIVPLSKSNSRIREYFIDMLRKAMYQSNISTRQMAVYGFCLILKQLRNNSIWRSTARSGPTQLSISGFSVMSQQISCSGNQPNATFNICVLEIIGILRKCFNQTYEIKDILYDGLSNAVQQNHKLIPHVLQFLDWHFRSYFNITDTISINFEKAIIEVPQGETTTIQINDHIGKLLQFITQCLIFVEDQEIDFDVSDLKSFFDVLIDKICSIGLDEIGLVRVTKQKRVISATDSFISLVFPTLERSNYTVLMSNWTSIYELS